MSEIKVNVEHILHKKSAVKDKMPTASQLQLGELAINYNAENPFISFKNSDGIVQKLTAESNEGIISGISVDDENEFILIDKVSPDGTLEQLSGDAKSIVFENDVKNGLEVISGNVNVKIDSASDSGLTVSSDGVKMNADAVIDSASTNAIENKEVWRNFDEIRIVSADTTTGKTYTLKVMNTNKDEVIKVPNDRYVSGITVDNTNQQIVLDVVKEDKTLQQLTGDATNIVFESDINNGLEVDTHNVKVKIDSTSVSGLTVSANGVKLTADTAINSASTNVVQNKVVYEQLDGLKFKHLTQAEYDALATKDSMTVYVIYEPNP